MLFYIGQIFFALAIALSLQFVKIEGISCAERISRAIEKTALGLYLNDVAHVGVFYLKKIVQKHKNKISVNTDSIKEYIPQNIKKAMSRVERLEKVMSSSKEKEVVDIEYPEEDISHEEVVFDGIGKVISGNKATQGSEKDINSSASEK